MVAGDYPNNLSPFDFYHKYKIWIDDRGYRAGEIEESLILNVPSEMPIGFSEELRIQKIIRRLLFQTLNISQPLKDLANSVIVQAKAISTTKIYEIDNLQELLHLEIINMNQSSTVIKKCENCGKYFIPKHKSQKYCNRIDETGLICAKAAKKKLKKDRLESNPALKLYDTAYKKYHARYKNGIINQQQFNSWQYRAKEKLMQVEKGTLDISVFQEWLRK